MKPFVLGAHCCLWLLVVGTTSPGSRVYAADAKRVFRGGAAVIDVTPTNFPVIVNAMFEERSTTRAVDALHSRSLALDDGQERLVITVVDTCMMPRDLIDQAKALAARATGIPSERMLISATHTHSAPSAMGCLGSRADTNYAAFLPSRIAEGIKQAVKNLAPARIGWGVIDDPEHTHNRRWIRRPDRLLTDPFGDKNVRANMHPGHQNPDAIGPSGPVDPALSLLSVQTPAGKPVALLANYSMHYYESPLLSADYYGLFATKIAKLIGAAGGNGPFVGIMSQGTSGDQMWMDYGAPQKKIGLDAYAQEVAELAAQAYRKIEHRDWVSLAMRETKFTLGFRLPDEKRLAWARDVVSKMRGGVPRGMAEIYAKEAIYLHERPSAELIVQAIRIGDLGIAALPNEVYAISGLKIKAQSPLALTFNVELANGAEGYIPPPEQHRLGGYTTWPARTAGLETNAEPRIVEAALRLLEEVSGQPRRKVTDTPGDYAKAILAAKPVSYWRLNEFSGLVSHDARGGDAAAGEYEGNVAFYLEGPPSAAFSGDRINRAPHFAGGRLNSRTVLRTDAYSVDFWFWNGLASNARAITGFLFSQGSNRDQLYLGGTSGPPGRLVFGVGRAVEKALAGRSLIQPKTWNHVSLVRQAKGIAVYLNGRLEMGGEAEPGAINDRETWLVAGGQENEFNFEGKIDEVAFFDRPLSPDEIGVLHRASESPKKTSAALTAPAKLSSEARSAAESMTLLRVAEGFEVQLAAAEPLVASPVAIDWGADGRLWVVEMADYPMGMDGKMKAGGRVRFLEDINGDGRFDKSTVFLDGLNFPNGIITWRRGVIITAAPDIFYAEDTDGDGKADKREVLFTGFKEGNLQLRVNGLRWGLDNWLHCANGWSGGRPRSLKTGAEVDLSGRDLRIKPDEGLIEAESGQSEFGRNCNDWGDWFGCDNSYPLFHFALEDRYMRRNPYVAAAESKRQIYLPANPKVYPLSPGQKRYHSFEQAGHFTSACSTDFYRDDWLFARDGVEHAFICEPVHNLVQHLLVRTEGASFSATRAERDGEPEFLASEDQWFRPVMARPGPDGALWVVDMYRYMIEHPDWLPPEGRKELEPFYRQGESRGRIYRLVPKQRPASHPNLRPTRLDRLNVPELVAALTSPNGWVRDKAQQLLIWRGDKSAIEHLQKLAANGSDPRARLQALCALEGLGALSASMLEAALRDPHPAVRRHAVRLAETLRPLPAHLIEAVAKLADDPDAKVRLQLACSLGEWREARAGEALARLAVANVQDRSIHAAILSSATNHVAAIVDAAAMTGGPVLDAFGEPLLNLSLALHRRDLMARLLGPTLTPRGGRFGAGQMRTVSRFLDALTRAKTSAKALIQEHNDTFTEQLQRLDKVIGFARQVACDAAQPASERAVAVSLLGRETAQFRQDVEMLGGLLDKKTPGEVQKATVQTLARTGEPKLPDLLTSGWAAHAPEIRAAIVDVCLGREAWTLELLHQIERDRIAAVDLDASRRDRLLKHRLESVRALAGRVLATAANPDRRRAFEEFRPALALAGDAGRGKAVFARLCSTCHLLDEIGRDIGPNLISVKAHPPEKLLTSILEPSREVEPRYLAYHCTLNGGEELYGLIANETGNGLVLKLGDGTTRSLLRSEIMALQSSKVSLMPDGLEAGMTHQEMADLIRYLRAQPGLD